MNLYKVFAAPPLPAPVGYVEVFQSLYSCTVATFLIGYYLREEVMCYLH